MTSMPLTAAARHTALHLVSTEGEPALCRRLAALGLRRGAVLEVCHRTTGGAFVVAVAGTRIALGRELAHRLTVECR